MLCVVNNFEEKQVVKKSSGVGLEISGNDIRFIQQGVPIQKTASDLRLNPVLSQKNRVLWKHIKILRG